MPLAGAKSDIEAFLASREEEGEEEEAEDAERVEEELVGGSNAGGTTLSGSESVSGNIVHAAGQARRTASPSLEEAHDEMPLCYAEASCGSECVKCRSQRSSLPWRAACCAQLGAGGCCGACGGGGRR